MLMVAGGYNDGTPNGLTHDVELVSSSPGNKCTKRARPITGKWYDLGTHVETDAATLGMVGEVRRCQNFGIDFVSFYTCISLCTGNS